MNNTKQMDELVAILEQMQAQPRHDIEGLQQQHNPNVFPWECVCGRVSGRDPNYFDRTEL